MKKIIIFIMVMFATVVFASGIPVPTLERRVMDTAGIFDSYGVSKLTLRLQEIEKSGIQMAILTVPSLNGESIEDFSRRVVREWKLGDKGKDNGLLITISKGDRKWRVETGRGIQGALTDGVTKSIMTSNFVPFAKQGNFVGGLLSATTEMSNRYVSSLTPVNNKVNVVIPQNNEDNIFYILLIIAGVGILFFIVLSKITHINNKKEEEEIQRLIKKEEYYRKLDKEIDKEYRSSFIPVPIPVPLEPYYSPKKESKSESYHAPKSSDDDDDSSSKSSSSSSDSGFSGGGGSFDGGGSSGSW